MKRQHVWLGAAVVLVAALVAWWLLRPKPGGIELLEDEPAARSSDGAPASTRPTAGRTRRDVTSDAGLPAAHSGPGVELARFGWGSGDGNLGRSRPEEANPEAPMSLTVDALGQVWILDQVNGRLVKLDRTGKPVGVMPLPLQAAQDVAVTPDGKALVLDRLVDKSVAILSPDGKPLGELPLVGKGLEEGGASTGLFSDGKDVYVEREHGDSVRIGSTSGEANRERPEVPGRPAQDGRSLLTASIVDGPSGTVMITAIDRESSAHRFTRQLQLGARVIALNGLDTDRSGVIYLGTVLEQPDSTPEAPQFANTLLCLDPLDGRPLGQTRFPANTLPEETFRELTVLPEGGVLFLERTEAGPRLVRYPCP